MIRWINILRNSLAVKLIAIVGATLLVCIAVWAGFNIRHQQERFMEHTVNDAVRLSNTIKLGTHYAMMINARDDINQIITNIAKQREIETLRIYNKNGQIKFTNNIGEIDRITTIRDEACIACHDVDPPRHQLGIDQMTRLFTGADGTRRMGIIIPIPNEPGCAATGCHAPPDREKILGALDVVMSLSETEKEIRRFETGVIQLAVFVFLAVSGLIFFVMMWFVNRPIRYLIGKTHHIAAGDYSKTADQPRNDEIGALAAAIDSMGSEIATKQIALNKQTEEYRNLFETVPCEIAVLDRDYRLINFNRRFAEKFNPRIGEYCFRAYKGRDVKCEKCPVAKTFADGNSHLSEETGFNKAGAIASWLVVTAPRKDESGRIIGAMEMTVDLTELKLLEEKLKKSEKKYRDIFNYIPNPIFVLDQDSLSILDCNNSVRAVYGYRKPDLLNTSFLDLFGKGDRDRYAAKLKTAAELHRVRHISSQGKTVYVNIRVSPSEYEGKMVYLVTTSDITKRLEAEQQLIQASKMATLGEMATGVAHELNQPLSVIKTASSFLMKKIRRKTPIDPQILFTLAAEIDSHIDRATRIIGHMREFGRKSDLNAQDIDVNMVIEKAFDIFSQQLKLRGIEIVRELQADLPPVRGDAGKLEQVIINLLINARDAIEDRWPRTAEPDQKKIMVRTRADGRAVIIELEDTGKGIPADIIDKIFEPFFTTKTVGKGTGIGLSISYSIVQEYGGSITAEPDRAEGARFVIRFPVFREDGEKPDRKD